MLADTSLELDADGLESFLKSPSPLLVDFWSDWCEPCHQLTPILTEIAQEFAGRVEIGKVDIGSHPAVASQYGITTLPTLVMFVEGAEVRRIVGLRPKDHLMSEIERFL